MATTTLSNNDSIATAEFRGSNRATMSAMPPSRSPDLPSRIWRLSGHRGHPDSPSLPNSPEGRTRPLRVLLIAVSAAALLVSCSSSANRDNVRSRSTSSSTSDLSSFNRGGAGDKNSQPVPAYEPVLDESKCADATTDTSTIDCYTLTVPESRADPTGRQVELPVIRVRSAGTGAGLPTSSISGAGTGSATSQDSTSAPEAPLEGADGKDPAKLPGSVSEQAPLVYLHGGPGGGAVDGWLAWQQLMDGVPRDLFTYDQRGAGHANPRLDCPEHTAALATTLAEHPAWDEARQLIGASLQSCNKRLRSDGIDLTQYDTYNSAQDLEDLRRALGVEKLSLIGASYGTRLALAYESLYPERVASLALGGVVAPGSGGPEQERTMLDAALSRLFDSCATDPGCNSRYPTLKAKIETAAKGLDADPVMIGSTDPIKVTGDELYAGVFATLYDSSTIPLVPSAISRIASGDQQVWSTIGSQIAPLLTGDGAFGAQININCADLTAANTPGVKRAGAATSGADKSSAATSRSARSDPGRSRDLVLSSTDSFCEFWPIDDAAARPSAHAVHDVTPPTLVIAGELDPITPAKDARDMAIKLKGQYFEILRGGHDAMFTSPCARSVLREFMDDPASSTATSPGSAPGNSCSTDEAPPFA